MLGTFMTNDRAWVASAANGLKKLCYFNAFNEFCLQKVKETKISVASVVVQVREHYD